MTHTGLPIVASLANSAVSFTCKITYQYTPKFQPFTVSYFHVDLQGRTSRKQPTGCRPASGTENQTYTLDCRVTLRLPNASATGSYYCCLLWPSSTVTVTGNSTFILVRGEAPLASSRVRGRWGHLAELGAQDVKGGAGGLDLQRWQSRTEHPQRAPCPKV